MALCKVQQAAVEARAQVAEKGNRVAIAAISARLEDENCQVINDQFMIGDTLLVAPVLHQGVRRRSVYLPGPSNGSDIVWKRGTDGPYHRGGQWVQNIEVALDEVLYFEKKADGARPDGLSL